MNYGMIFYVLGMILNFEALFMLPSLVVALIYGEWAGMSILTTIVICLALGILAVFRKPQKKTIYARKVLSL